MLYYVFVFGYWDVGVGVVYVDEDKWFEWCCSYVYGDMFVVGCVVDCVVEEVVEYFGEYCCIV